MRIEYGELPVFYRTKSALDIRHVLRGKILGVRELVHRITDEHLVSEIGSLYRGGVITLSEYEAGIKYGKVVLNYLETIDAPSPYSSERCESFSDEQCERRKLAMASARQVLKDLRNPKAASVVDRVTVYGEPVYADDIAHLRQGLQALSGN